MRAFALIFLVFLGFGVSAKECDSDKPNLGSIQKAVQYTMTNVLVSFRRYNINSIKEKGESSYEATMHNLARGCMTMQFDAHLDENCEAKISVNGLIPCVRP